MNVTEEVTIHRPNVSTHLSSAFIRGDLNAATRIPFIWSLISGLFFWRGVSRRQETNRHRHDLKERGRMPSVVKAPPQFFSPFSAQLPIQLSWCEMETSFLGLLGMSAYLRLIETLFGVQQLSLGLPENIPARHLQRVLQYLLLTSRFSDDCFPYPNFR